MERLVLSCGGVCINSPEELEPEILGYAGEVYEHVLGEEKYTFVEKVANPTSCTILLKGPNDHTLSQLKDAVRDGLRAVKNTLQDKAVVAGAGAFEAALNVHLLETVKKTVEGRAKRGVEAFAEAMLIIPKTLAENSGYDAQDVCIALTDEVAKGTGNKIGLDITTGEAFDPATAGGEVRIPTVLPIKRNRSTHQVKPFYLSSETVLPIKCNRSTHQVKPLYLSTRSTFQIHNLCAATRRRVRQLHRQDADPALRACHCNAAAARRRGHARGRQHAQALIDF
jgi:hypothetical protein